MFDAQQYKMDQGLDLSNKLIGYSFYVKFGLPVILLTSTPPIHLVATLALASYGDGPSISTALLLNLGEHQNQTPYYYIKKMFR
jgi:hypothetical protein